MRLSSLSQELLPTTLVDALRTLGIVSDADLFFSGTTLEVWRKLPPDLIPLSEFESRVKAVMIQCAVPGFVATEVEARLSPNQLKPGVITGVDNLDNLLGATLRESLVEISGRHGNGAAVRPLFLPCFIFRLEHFLSLGEFQGTRPTDRVQPFGFSPEHDRIVDRYDRGLFSHESGHRPPIDGTARGPCSDRAPE